MQFSKEKIKLYTSILTGVLFLAITTQIHAQYNRPISWGLTAGINNTNMYGDDVNGTSSVTGFSGGAWLNVRFNKYFSIQPEALFSTKGTDMDDSLTGESVTTEYRFGYLEFPLLAKLHLPTGGNFEPNFYIGPELGLTLYGDANEVEIDDKMSDAEFGLVFGGGIDFYIGQSSTDFIQKIGLDLRYSFGLTDTFDVTGDPDASNEAFKAAITLGF